MEDEPRERPRCPECATPMAYVRTIWRAFEPTIDIWECRACQKTVRQPSTR